MSDIVLTTFNAKYIHAAFGLRYLLANLGELRERAALVEFDIHHRAADIVESLLERQPKIVGIGVYIWNAQLCAEVVTLLKRVAPAVVVILGGPEVSYEFEEQPVVVAADYVILGEADLKFAELCHAVLSGTPPEGKIVPADLPDLSRVVLPYEFYDERDIKTRVIYVEASRGCPFTCEFCLSSLDLPVRQFPLAALMAALDRLLSRGVQHFKFVDRTFNLNLSASRAILQFFLERYRPGLFLHFEMIPDRLPDALRELIAQFAPGVLQFEVGIQTFNTEVADRIKRRQNEQKLAENFRFLREQTGVHIHADLIVGLPGEDLESFGRGFDRLVSLGPQEIQVGILKRLRGTPIVRHDREWSVLYSHLPPYEILQNKLISFPEMQRMRRFARFWDLVANSGNFLESAPLIWAGSDSPFKSFATWADWLFLSLGRQHSISLLNLAELLFKYLINQKGDSADVVAPALWRDYQRAGRSERPPFLEPFVPAIVNLNSKGAPRSGGKRQARHQRAEPAESQTRSRQIKLAST